MLNKILEGIARLEKLQTQAWGMIMTKNMLYPTKKKPEIGLAVNLCSVTDTMGSHVVKFDPSLQDADRWELQSIDGKKPNDGELRSHKKRYSGRSQKLPMEQLPPVGEMIPQSSVFLLDSVSQGYLIAGFTPHIKLPVIGDIAKRLIGRIWYNIEKDYIERVVVQNEQPLSPVPGLSIGQFHLGMRFGMIYPQQNQAEVVMKESELLVVGKKLFKSFNQISFYEYSDHWLPE